MSVSCSHCHNPLTDDEGKGASCPRCGKPAAAATVLGTSLAGLSPRPTFAPIEGASAWGTVRVALGLFAVGFLLLAIGAAFEIILTQTQQNPNFLVARELLWVNLLWYYVVPALYQGGVALGVAALGMSMVSPAGKRWVVAGVFATIAGGIALLLQHYGNLENQMAEIESRDNVLEKLIPVRQEMTRAKGDVKKQIELFHKARGIHENNMPEKVRSPEALVTLRLAWQGALLLGGVFYMSFMRSVARHLRRRGLSAALLVYIIVCSVIGVGAFVLMHLAENSSDLAPLFGGTLMWGWVGLLAAFCLWTTINLFLLRDAVTRAALRPSL